VLEFDARLESRYKPNSQTTVRSQYGEFAIHYSFNELGLRDRPLPATGDDGTLRVLALGNSFVEGWGVADTEAFLRVAEQELVTRLRRPVRLINAGMSGYGAGQCYLLFQELADRVKPDAVLFFYVPTMVSADQKFLARAEKDAQGLATGLNVDQVLAGVPTKAEPVQSIAANCPLLRAGTVYSHLVRLVVALIDSRRARNRIVPGDPQTDLLAAYRAGPDRLAELHAPTFRHIEALARASERRQTPFLVVTLAMPFEVSAVEWSRGRAVYKTGTDPAAYRPTRELAAKALEKAKVPFVSAYDFLSLSAAQKAEDNPIYYAYDFHLNPTGNRLLGEWLGQVLAERKDFVSPKPNPNPE
jgi:lysophospholipase L1-like esterase